MAPWSVRPYQHSTTPAHNATTATNIGSNLAALPLARALAPVNSPLSPSRDAYSNGRVFMTSESAPQTSALNSEARPERPACRVNSVVKLPKSQALHPVHGRRLPRLARMKSHLARVVICAV